MYKTNKNRPLKSTEINLPFKYINGLPVKHLSWRDIYEVADWARADSNHEQKHLLIELQEYLKGIMTMQNKESNMVYVVALGTDNPKGCDISWIDIVKRHNRYFCPVGGNGWPKEPPNYIGFRYHGKLQSIHHVEDYVITKNVHDEVPNMPDELWDGSCFIYNLGPAIIVPKEVRTGNIFRNARVWEMLDTLLTADTISEARDITKQRREV